MLLRRHIRLSVYRQAKALLEALGYTVLSEDDLAAANAGSASPSGQVVYLLHAPTDPLVGAVRVPAVLVILEFEYGAFELGSRAWAASVEAGFLVLAGSRRERDEIADQLAQGFKTLTVYDFDQNPPVPIATVDVQEPVESTPVAVPEELARQGAMRFAEEITLSFRVYLPGA